MGRKKKFIDKKNSATFQLLARDSSDPNNSHSANGSDRVFVRVDNNQYLSQGFLDDVDENETTSHNSRSPHLDGPDSIFADAPGDDDDDQIGGAQNPVLAAKTTMAIGSLPDHIRREILELGFPDDGYNYLLHLREIRAAGGGSSFFHNSKAKLDQVPLDVKAYDSSRVRIHSEIDSGDSSANSMYNVASKTVGVKIQKAVDPDVAALLDDSDLSRFGSDVEDLEEDFVVQANVPEDGEEEKIAEYPSQVQEVELIHGADLKSHEQEGENEFGGEKPRVRRLLDEQFDLLTLREYDRDCDSDDDGSFTAENESFALKLNHALKDHVMDDLELDDQYRVPGDFIHGDQESSKGKQMDFSADVIRKCAEYAEMYSNENQDNADMMVLQESSDESEVWDCETIVSTYSNLDNHPGKIQAPEKPRKRLAIAISGASSNNNHVISLRGKEKLPVEFLPMGRKNVMEKEKKAPSLGDHRQKRRPHGEESKEEKKERKSAIKEERREARRAKKELKELYKCEAQRAQKVAAISAPSSIHLM
ncbi:uncharacterized protein LOC131243401 isoform X2 [Magnolia sinica]|uniref:uncharacterized protein LOC131243401 isoform X2 n=1 Tax=Magnolia sinica TaxID=86752 RepID=UPI00265A4B84|nr:uncharacterized protein LOC131243401 isoform X2 [Magnolia sinica]